MDLTMWNRVTSELLAHGEVPLSNDLPSWNTLTPAEQQTVVRVSTGLTLLDTIQGTVGDVEMIEDAVRAARVAVIGNFIFMKRSMLKVTTPFFSTLCSTKEIDRLSDG